MMNYRADVKKTLVALGNRMRDRRRVLGLSQEQLAERSGLSTNYVACIEIGMKAPSLSSTIKLARALEMEVSDILAVEDARWTDEARELAFSLRSLPDSEAEFLLKQFRADIRHSRALLSDKSRKQGG